MPQIIKTAKIFNSLYAELAQNINFNQSEVQMLGLASITSQQCIMDSN